VTSISNRRESVTDMDKRSFMNTLNRKESVNGIGLNRRNSLDSPSNRRKSVTDIDKREFMNTLNNSVTSTSNRGNSVNIKSNRKDSVDSTSSGIDFMDSMGLERRDSVDSISNRRKSMTDATNPSQFSQSLSPNRRESVNGIESISYMDSMGQNRRDSLDDSMGQSRKDFLDDSMGKNRRDSLDDRMGRSRRGSMTDTGPNRKESVNKLSRKEFVSSLSRKESVASNRRDSVTSVGRKDSVSRKGGIGSRRGSVDRILNMTKFDVVNGDDNDVDEEEQHEKGYSFNALIVVDFMDNVIPNRNLFKEKTGNILNLIAMNHDYFRSLSGATHYISRTCRFLGLMVIILSEIFTDTLFFGIFYPSDGTCNVYTYERTCISVPSKLSADASQCTWDSEASTCAVIKPPESVIFTVIISLILIILTVPIIVFLEILLENYACTWPGKDYSFNGETEKKLSDETEPNLREVGNETLFGKVINKAVTDGSAYNSYTAADLAQLIYTGLIIIF
jgi:hypothetical protein